MPILSQRLIALPEITQKLTDTQNSLDPNEIRTAFEGFISEMSGGKLPIEFGSGNWLERMSGKEIFRAVANECFKVEDSEGNILRGKTQHGVIAKELLRQPIEKQPADFATLFELISNRIKAA